MGINIGNNNKIKNSTIGNNNIQKQDNNKAMKIFWEILIAVFINLAGIKK